MADDLIKRLQYLVTPISQYGLNDIGRTALDAISEITYLTAQRDELVAALEPFAKSDLTSEVAINDYAMNVLRARSALARVKGGE